MENSSPRAKGHVRIKIIRRVSRDTKVQSLFLEVMFSFLLIRYQAEVNRSMGVYRQKYEDWFNGLSEAERKAETSRMNSGKSTRARNNAAAAAAAAQGSIKRSLIMSTNM